MYKIMKFIVICITLMASFFASSCKKYLEAKSDDKLVVPDNLPALQAILDNGQYMNGSSPSIGLASADDYFLTPEEYNAVSVYCREAYIWDLAGQSDYNYGFDWPDIYFLVYNANLCLDQLTKIKRTSLNADAWDYLKGDALFFRGLSFLELSWLFSKAYNKETAKQDLGIVLRLGSDFNVPSKRASVEESYQRVLQDLKSSLSFMPNTVEYLTRPTKAAVYGYLSRAYLSMRLYDSALAYANKCLQFNSKLMDFNDPNDVDMTNIYPIPDQNKEIIHINYIGLSAFSSVNNKHASVDTLLYNSYQASDLRKVVYFSPPEGNSAHFYGSYKGRSVYFTGIATDEMYLVKAECEARNNQVEDAMNDLNKLLIKRWKTGTFKPFTASSQAEALKLILKERRKELVFRGLRWMDIKRLNLEGANISIRRQIEGKSYILSPNDNRFALPLATDLLSLTGMQQNPQ